MCSSSPPRDGFRVVLLILAMEEAAYSQNRGRGARLLGGRDLSKIPVKVHELWRVHTGDRRVHTGDSHV